MKKDILQVSFSGGRSSAFMCYILENYKRFEKYEKVYLFANTGKEREETLKFVDECDKAFGLNLTWLEAKVTHKFRVKTTFEIVNFKTASRNGKPFEEVIKKYGLPSKMYRHCTRELKIRPMESYMDTFYQGSFKTALGMRVDEPSRVKSNGKFVYPLVEVGVNENMVREFWNRMPFDLQLKDYQGNCDVCFLKSTKKKLTILKENPEWGDWWLDMENIYSGGNQPRFDVVRKHTVEDLIKIATNFDNMARDKFESGAMSFDLTSPINSIDFDCFCGNT